LGGFTTRVHPERPNGNMSSEPQIVPPEQQRD
jgi:hypothetical protein